jgi:hypothetical protein
METLLHHRGDHAVHKRPLGLGPRQARAVHDPGKTVLDVALALALGGDCLADVALLRVEPALFGLVASDPTVSRLVDALAAAGPTALTAIRAARSLTRQRAWSLACRAGWPPFRVSGT